MQQQNLPLLPTENLFCSMRHVKNLSTGMVCKCLVLRIYHGKALERLNTGIMCSNPARGMDEYLRFCVLCFPV
jgi:hypothetical protein